MLLQLLLLVLHLMLLVPAHLLEMSSAAADQQLNE